MIILLLMLLVEVSCVGSFNALEGSYKEATVYTGIVSAALRASLETFMEVRLRPSSISTINTAWNKHWIPFCNEYGLPDFVADGDPNRAGIMASFVLTLANKGTLVYSSMQGYLWAVVNEHLSKGHASPLANVRDWKLFMHAVQVECHEPSEPRKMVPWVAFTTFFRRINSLKYNLVVVGTYCLFLFFTIARPEIIPKAYSGQNSWDNTKHLILEDFRNVKGYLEVCLRGIKQDPLATRREAVKGKAWRAIGKGPKLFDLEAWLHLMCNMRKALGLTMDASSPLFLMENGRPLIYSKAVQIMREIMDTFLPAGESKTFSVGGIRVLAYNIYKSVCGDTTARIQGMWGSDAHELYDRADLQKILGMPSRMLGFSMDPNSVPKAQLENVSPLIVEATPATQIGVVEPVVAQPNKNRRNTGVARPLRKRATSSSKKIASSSSKKIIKKLQRAAPSSKKSIPEGWSRVQRSNPNLKRTYFVYVRASDGKVAESLPAVSRLTEFTPTMAQAKRVRLT